VQEKVVFVPGNPFYTGSGPTSTFRFSFSCVDSEMIEEGVRRMASALRSFEKMYIMD
jgi:2-aminoadipate transaminase